MLASHGTPCRYSKTARRPERTKAISRWWSVAKPPEDRFKTKGAPAGARAMHTPVSSAPLVRQHCVDVIPEWLASLHHRLTALTPPASPHTNRLPEGS